MNTPSATNCAPAHQRNLVYPRTQTKKESRKETGDKFGETRRKNEEITYLKNSIIAVVMTPGSNGWLAFQKSSWLEACIVLYCIGTMDVCISR